MTPSPVTPSAIAPDNIVQIPIEDLNPAPYNPRTWDEAALDQLCESIRRFGFLDPIVINIAPNRMYVVISGHMRISAARKLGMKVVPCLQVSISDIEREKELNIRMNRNTIHRTRKNSVKTPTELKDYGFQRFQ